jgi:Ca2+-binding RTX toxin-like protein
MRQVMAGRAGVDATRRIEERQQMTDVIIGSERYFEPAAGFNPGYAYTAGDVHVSIRDDILVGSAEDQGVISTGFDNNSLTNDGTILSGSEDGIWFSGDDTYIKNDNGARIIGRKAGIIIVGGDLVVIENSGEILGLGSDGVVLTNSSSRVSVTNNREIYGYERGINILADGGTINNREGIIHSAHTGIEVRTDTGVTTFINNDVDARIRGDVYAVHTSEGAIWLVNDGRLEVTVRCDAANENDGVINLGIITGNVVLGSGNDRYSGLGGGSVSGNIQGGLGNDTLLAGVQREVFFGQDGADIFDFRSVSFSLAGATRDAILDFDHAEADKIDLHFIDADATRAGVQHFTFIGTDTFAHYRSLHPTVVGMVRFDPGLDRLQGNTNGNFANAEFEVALTGVPALFASDLILV